MMDQKVQSNRTLFDDVASHANLSDANQYIVLAGQRTPEGDGLRGATILRVDGIDDAFVLGNMLGDTLRKSFGHEKGEAFLLAVAAGATAALHGEGLPSERPSSGGD